MSTGTFDQWQQVFTMIHLINKEGGAQNETASQLQGQLETTIQTSLNDPGYQALIGSSWTLAWGPCVYQDNNSGVVDNAMFVAQNTATNTFVIAIAGTSLHSSFDKITEDASVNPIMAWPYDQTMPSGAAFPADVCIAKGTSIGVDTLQGMQDSKGRSLEAFLQSVQSNSATLVFTGHSLGGALAPTLACALITQGALDLSQWGPVYVYPTAGPTPGNGAFVTLFQTLFPQTTVGAQPWQVWNSLIWNSLDIVPHAWSSTTMSQILGLYEPTVFPGLGTITLVQDAEKRASGQGYQQLPSNGPLTGTIVLPKDIPNPILDPSTDPFIVEAYYQHVNAYLSLLGVQALESVTVTRAAA